MSDVGQQFADLAGLLAAHPAPWSIKMGEGTENHVMDSHDNDVIAFSDDDDDTDLAFWTGIVAAVNLAAGMQP